MKRSAAIVGPTPPFLRWAIKVPCPFRDQDATSVTNSTFRDLRSLRAVAVGEIEDRVTDGICLHPDAKSDAQNALGFPVDEIYAAYGGAEHVRKNCSGCLANIPVSGEELESGSKFSRAGCFGWLTFGEKEQKPGFLDLLEVRSEEPISESIVDLFEQAACDVEASFPKLFSEMFIRTDPMWYGVWKSGTENRKQMILLQHICAKVRCESVAWRRLARAVFMCCEHQLDLHVDLTPAGESDGVNWRIEPACARCGVSSPQKPCTVCGSSSVPEARRKTKVLGLRPYLKLATVIGEEQTKQLLNREAN